MFAIRTICLVGTVLVSVLLRPMAAAALTACTAADIIAQDPGCPAGDGVCTITLSFEVPGGVAGCDLDFENRAVVLEGALTSGWYLTLASGALTLKPGSAIRAAYVRILAQGDVWIQRQDRYVRGLITIVGRGYEIEIHTPGHVRVDGDLLADGTYQVGEAGRIYIFADAGLETGAESLISADGIAPKDDYYFSSGSIYLKSEKGPVALAGTVSAIGTGSDEGDVHVESAEDAISIGGRVRLDGWFAFQDGGTLLAYAETGVAISAKVTTVAGPTILGVADGYGAPSGQILIITPHGDVVLDGQLVTDGVLYGYPGDIYAETWTGSLFLSGSISARPHRYHSYTGSVTLYGKQRLEISGSIDLGHGSNLGIGADQVDLGGSIVGHFLFTGPDGSYYYSDIATIDVAAHDRLRLSGSIDLSSTGCVTLPDYGDEPFCAEPWTLAIDAPKEIEITAQAQIRGKGRVGSDIQLTTQRLTVAGSLDARGDETNGFVDLTAGVSCSFTGSAQPLPVGLHGACAPDFTPPPTSIPTATQSSAPATPTATPGPSTSTPTPSQPPSPACIGDCDASLAVDATDLARIIDVLNACAGSLTSCEVFTPEQACPAADANGDGVISAGELTRILAAAGSAAACP